MCGGKAGLRRWRGGFTLIELAVSVAVIGVLISLLLVGVSAARESSRALNCQNNFKQLTLGLQQLVDANGERYPSYSKGFDGPSCSSVTYHVASHTLGINSDDTFLFGYFYRRGSEDRTLIHSPSLFKCPSDSVTEYAGSYVANVGVEIWAPNDRWHGPFGDSPTSVASVSSGLSNTACFSERIVAHGVKDYPASMKIFSIAAGDGPSPWRRADAREFSRSQPDAHAFNFSGQVWYNGAYGHSVYTHSNVPNSEIVDVLVLGSLNATSSYGGMISARSRHPGGVYVSRLDGSVGFVSSDVDIEVWERLGAAR